MVLLLLLRGSSSARQLLLALLLFRGGGGQNLGLERGASDTNARKPQGTAAFAPPRRKRGRILGCRGESPRTPPAAGEVAPAPSLPAHALGRTRACRTRNLTNPPAALASLAALLSLADFFSFALHVAGFSIGQTALPALLSRFASKEDQGKSLGLGQAFQAAARVAAPVASGFLYDNSKDIVGSEYAAPYIVGGAICVAAGLPLLCMLSKSRAEKEGAGSGAKVEEEEGGGAGEGGQGGAIVEAEMVEVNL
jgi:hypothetical protein